MNIKIYPLMKLLLSIFFFLNLAFADSYESPSNLKAHKVLDSKLFQSKNYEIEEDIKNNGYINTYSIKSRFGNYQEKGYPQFVNRLNEIEILAILEEKYPSTTVIKDATYNAGEKIITAPIKGVSKVIDTVSDTGKLKKNVKSIPGGIKNIFSLGASTISSGAEFAYDSGKNIVGSNENSPSVSTGEQFDTFTDFISEKALDYTGYNKAAKELMMQYKINPFTINQELRFEIKRIAGIQAGIGTSANFAPSIPSIPGVSTFNNYVDTVNKISAYEDPKKIEEINQKILEVISKDEKGNKDWQNEFLKNEFYNPITKSIILHNLEKIGVTGSVDFVKSAARAKGYDAITFYVISSKKLLDLHQNKERLKALIVEANLPAGLSEDGTLYLPLAVDHLVWTPEVNKIFRGYKDIIIKKHKVEIKKVIILISGSVTPKCKEELIKLGAEVKSNQGY